MHYQEALTISKGKPITRWQIEDGRMVTYIMYSDGSGKRYFHNSSGEVEFHKEAKTEELMGYNDWGLCEWDKNLKKLI